MAGSNDPQILAFLVTIIVLDSIFLGWVGALTPGLNADSTPALFNPRDIKNYNLNLSVTNISNASSTMGGQFELNGNWVENATYEGWESTGGDCRIYLNNLNVNGYGNYDNTYYISNPGAANFDVFISYPKGIISFGSAGIGNKKVILEVRGTAFTVPTAYIAGVPNWVPLLGDWINDDRVAQKSYNQDDFTIRTVYNETSGYTEVYVDGQQIIAGNDLGMGVVYIGSRVFGGLQVYGPGLILRLWETTASSVTTSWYGDPVTGFLLGAWNFFKTAFALFVWDFSYPEDWQFVMNGVYILFVRIPTYIALFIGIRLLRGTG